MVEVHHAVAETPLVQQLEVNPDVTAGEDALAAACSTYPSSDAIIE